MPIADLRGRKLLNSSKFAMECLSAWMRYRGSCATAQLCTADLFVVAEEDDAIRWMMERHSEVQR